ncbi:hypothetical protein D3C80_1823000 [compost metagenome]
MNPVVRISTQISGGNGLGNIAGEPEITGRIGRKRGCLRLVIKQAVNHYCEFRLCNLLIRPDRSISVSAHNTGLTPALQRPGCPVIRFQISKRFQITG